ncbi:MAG: pyridoxamine 5'-phosphate oxidase family protein [Haloplanus sp.]
MEHVEYVYTVGMDESELTRRLGENDVGVLSLADGGRAYGVPVHYHYDDGQLLLRLGEAPESEKGRYVETTDEASFLVFDADGEWSVIARGPLRRLDDVDDDRLNETFDTFRLFGEDVAEVTVAVYELDVRSLTGRRVAA